MKFFASNFRAFSILISTLLYLSLPVTAHGTVYVLKIQGNVSSISTLQNSISTQNPAGIISVGDSYILNARFDTSRAEVSALFDSDPEINIYNFPGSKIRLEIGDYRTEFSPTFSFNSSVQIWNDRNVIGPTDAESYNFLNFDIDQGNTPFDIGVGLRSESINYNQFDFTSNVRNDDLVSSLNDPVAFGSRSFSYGVLNSASNLFVFVSGGITGATLTAVPEPESWMLLIFGFGFVGRVLRSKRARHRTVARTKFA